MYKTEMLTKLSLYNIQVFALLYFIETKFIAQESEVHVIPIVVYFLVLVKMNGTHFPYDVSCRKHYGADDNHRCDYEENVPTNG